MKKRCQKGKSCGASCISKSKVCRKDLGEVGKEIPKTKATIQGRKGPSKAPSFEPASKPIQGSPEGLGIMNKVTDLFSDPNTKRNDVDGVAGADKVNWRAGLGKGARYDAKGAYGAFVDVPPENLAKGLGAKFPGGVGIKYGEIGEDEVNMLKLAGQTGAAPRLIAARVGDPGVGNPKYGERMGMIAMERVPGVTLAKAFSNGDISKEDITDKYLSTIAKLHRAGIYHGDGHLGNAMLRSDGQVKFIDMGLAGKLPSMALSEALYLARNGVSPGYIGKVESSPVIDRLRSNFQKIVDSGKMDRYEGLMGWGDREERQRVAAEIIKELYRGI